MFKYVFILVIFLLLSGCTDYMGNSTLEEKPEPSKIETNDILVSTVDIDSSNIKDRITNDRKKCYDIWMSCNNIFDFAIRVIKDKKYEEFKFFFTENIKLENGRVFNTLSTQSKEFTLPEGEYSFRQRFYNLSNNDTVFDTCYEVRYKDGRNIEGCYVRFIYKDSKWYIDEITIDIG